MWNIYGEPAERTRVSWHAPKFWMFLQSSKYKKYKKNSESRRRLTISHCFWFTGHAFWPGVQVRRKYGRLAALKTQKVFQCKNCQRVGHATTNCLLSYHCDQVHGLAEWSKTNEQTPKCVNCRGNDHPANYRNCLMFVRVMARRNALKRAPPSRPNSTPRTITNLVS